MPNFIAKIWSADFFPNFKVAEFEHELEPGDLDLQATKPLKEIVTWNLCRRGIAFFQKELYRIPGNGKDTQLWQDRIMGQPPLYKVEGIRGIRDWLKTQGYLMLADIVAWKDDGKWHGWEIPRLP